MEKTLNQIVDIVRGFTATYPLVNTIEFGTARQLNSFIQNQDNQVMVYMQPVNIVLSQNLITYQIRFGAYDSRGKNLDNLVDIWSDTAQILTDFRKWLIFAFEENDIWSLSAENVTLLPVVNVTNDWVSGWEMTINISTVLLESDCLVPKEI
jgi:hypothetical protein